MINNQAISRHIGHIGFSLSIIGFFSLGLTTFTSIIFCLVGLFQMKGKTFSIIGLFIASINLLVLYLWINPMVQAVFSLSFLAVIIFFLCITNLFRKKRMLVSLCGVFLCVTHIVFSLVFLHIISSSHCDPDVESEYKYRILSRKSAFWLDFDPQHLNKVCYVGDKFGASGNGKFYFIFDIPGKCTIEKIITYAEQHNWLYRGKVSLTKENVVEFYDSIKNNKSTTDIKYNNFLAVIFEWYNMGDCEIWIKDDCYVLAFDTGHYAGFPSYVIISQDDKEMLPEISNKGSWICANLFWTYAYLW